jgi:hypothetical protein
MSLKEGPSRSPVISAPIKDPSKTVTSGSSRRFKIHMSLQHKGGSTKSFTANVIAQFYKNRSRPAVVLDADPSNKTLMAYQGIGARPVDIMAPNNTIDPRLFDSLLEEFLTTASDFVVDNGAANFPPLMNYMVENSVPSVLAEAGRDLVFHVPIVGGEAMAETMGGFNDIAQHFEKDMSIVLWLNEAVKGPISKDGKQFEESKVYQDHRSKVSGIVTVPHHSGETFGTDMEQLLKSRMTFDEGIASPSFYLMSKQRLKQMQREIFDQIAVVI